MSLKSFLIGNPIESVKEKHERLTKVMGLAIFSSDAMSSVAYATEEILFALVLAGTAMLHYFMPVAIAISTLIAIVAISYYQTIHAYPQRFYLLSRPVFDGPDTDPCRKYLICRLPEALLDHGL